MPKKYQVFYAKRLKDEPGIIGGTGRHGFCRARSIMFMVYQPMYLVGMGTYAALSVATLAGAWVKRRAPGGFLARRQATVLLLLIGFACGCYALDNWQVATHRPVIGMSPYGPLHWAGGVFLLAQVSLMIFWAFKRGGDGPQA